MFTLISNVRHVLHDTSELLHHPNYPLSLSDLTIDSFPKELMERNVIYWHGTNKNGNKIRKYHSVCWNLLDFKWS